MATVTTAAASVRRGALINGSPLSYSLSGSPGPQPPRCGSRQPGCLDHPPRLGGREAVLERGRSNPPLPLYSAAQGMSVTVPRQPEPSAAVALVARRVGLPLAQWLGSTPQDALLAEPVMVGLDRLAPYRLGVLVAGDGRSIDVCVADGFAFHPHPRRCPDAVSVTTSVTRYLRSRTWSGAVLQCRRPPGRPGVTYTNGWLALPWPPAHRRGRLGRPGDAGDRQLVGVGCCRAGLLVDGWIRGLASRAAAVLVGACCRHVPRRGRGPPQLEAEPMGEEQELGVEREAVQPDAVEHLQRGMASEAFKPH